MVFTQLSRRLQRIVEKNRKAYNKKYGNDPDRGKFNNNLTAKFLFDETPEGEVFWRVVEHCDDMTHLEIMPEYGRFLKNRRKKLFKTVTFILSMFFYAWLFHKLWIWLAPNEEIKNLIFFR